MTSGCRYLQDSPKVLNWVAVRQTRKTIQNSDVIVVKPLAGDNDVWSSTGFLRWRRACISLPASRRQTKDLEIVCPVLSSNSHFSWRDVKRRFLFAVSSRKRSSLSHVFLGRRDLFLQLIAPASSLFRQFFTDPRETPTVLAMLRSPRPHSFKASILPQCRGRSCRSQGILKLTPAVRLFLNFVLRKIGHSATGIRNLAAL